MKLLAGKKKMASNAFTKEDLDIDVSDINIQGVDAELGCSLCGEEIDLYIGALRNFAEKAHVSIDKISGVTEETLHAYTVAVHGLKNSFAIIGAEEMRARALYLEVKSKSNDISTVLACNEGFVLDAKKIVNDIQNWLNDTLK
jgi:hypothetical protein